MWPVENFKLHIWLMSYFYWAVLFGTLMHSMRAEIITRLFCSVTRA